MRSKSSTAIKITFFHPYFSIRFDSSALPLLFSVECVKEGRISVQYSRKVGGVGGGGRGRGFSLRLNIITFHLDDGIQKICTAIKYQMRSVSGNLGRISRIF